MVYPTLFSGYWWPGWVLMPVAKGLLTKKIIQDLSASSTFLNNSHFAFSLYRRMVAANPGKNIIFSLLSFSIPPTLLALQARSEVHTPVLEGPGFPLTQVPDDGVHAHCSQPLLASLRPLAACQPDVDSILFVDQKWYLAQRIVDIAQNPYHMEVFLIPFGNNHIAREQMDHFTSKTTHFKIRKLAQELNPGTILILVNYIFFKSAGLGPAPVFLPSAQLMSSSCLQPPHHCCLPPRGKARDTEEALMREKFDTWWSQPFPLSQLEQLLPSMGMPDIFRYHAGITGISLQTIPHEDLQAHQGPEQVHDHKPNPLPQHQHSWEDLQTQITLMTFRQLHIPGWF
uniref:serpin A3-1-like n=1 Tax=Odobenus rosmarus divergens TaxID=9708 RepID=UPI00063CD0FD|nr:PREDICTED: serpin A3-1-like [Odobenus rosmarus divergens]